MTGAVAGAPSPAALRALLDLAAVPMLLQDARPQILMVNSAFELATGFALAQCLGRDLAEFDPAQDPRARLRRRDEELQQPGSFHRQGLREGEFAQRRIRRVNGSIYEFRQQYRELRGADGGLLRFCVLLDAQAGEAGRALIDFHGDRVAAAFGADSIATMMRDAELRVTEVDPALSALTGFAAAELIGSAGILDVDMGEAPGASLQARLRAVVTRRGGIDDGIVAIRTRDGQRRWVRHRCTPVLRGRHLQGLVCVLTEVGDAATATPTGSLTAGADALTAGAVPDGARPGEPPSGPAWSTTGVSAGEAARMAWKLGPDLQVLLVPATQADAADAPVFRVLACNDRAVQTLGIPPTVLIADPSALLRGLDPSAREQLLTFWRRAAGAREGVHEIELPHHQAGRESRQLRWRLATASADEPWLLTVEDVSRSRELERQREQTASQQRDVLVREVHHRIKNNLQGVAGLVQQLADQRPELAGALDQIVAQVQAIAQVHGMQVASGSTLGPVAMVEAICRHLARNFGVPIGIDGGEAVDGRGLGLPESEAVPLALILNELGTNAIKHRVPGGRVSVRWQMRDEAVVIEVINDGALPTDFERRSRLPGGNQHGLSLIRSMMPRRGATLRFTQEGGQVIAALSLSPPILIRAARPVGT